MKQAIDQNFKEEIFKRLDVLSEKLGVASEHLWELFTTQALIEGISTLVLLSAILLISSTTLRYALKTEERFFTSSSNRYDSGEPTLKFFLTLISSIVTFISFVIFCSTFVSSLSKIFNSEYYAWLEIKSLIN